MTTTNSIVREFLPKTLSGLRSYRRELTKQPLWPYIVDEIQKVDHMIWVLTDNPNHYE